MGWTIGAVVVGQVAVDASRAVQAVVVIDVALRALHGGMKSGKCEAGGGVVERRSRPVRGGVAGIASDRETGGFVRRIIGAVVISLVAVDAGRAVQAVIVVDVTLQALHGGMESGEREACRRMVEGGTGPVGGGVTQSTVLREPGGFVGRIICAVVVGQVAVNAGPAA